jgi:ribonucleoside-diphosphate reductase alpha chain
MKGVKTYTYEEAFDSSLEYFNGNEFSAKVFVDKYALKNEKEELVESNPRQMHRRLAKEFARIEAIKFKKPYTEDEIFSFFDKFEKIIPQGSPMCGIGNDYQITSLSNCFVVPSPIDSYGGIFYTDEQLAQISKRRGGVGTDISNLRPIGTLTKNAARTSTGSVTFAERYSHTINEVGQNGRRGAEMMSMSIHHPDSVILWDRDVEGEPFSVHVATDSFAFDTTSEYFNPDKIDFITCKYDPKKVTGANISVRITDEFLHALENDEDYEQRWPVINSKNPIISKRVNAKRVWKKIIRSAWQTAEPGILFWDNIIRESIADCYKDFGFETISTNPCGEIPLSAYDSCRLLLLNLYGFVKNPFTKDAYFDLEEFYNHAQIAQRLMDDLVDLEAEAIQKIIDKVNSDPEPNYLKTRELDLWENMLEVCLAGRRTGTGITALGDALAAINIAYGSEDSIGWVDTIYKTLKLGCYRSSVEMAKEIGSFPIWDYELEKNNPFLNRIKEERVYFDDGSYICGEDLYNEMKKYGRRNISLLTTAPAGSVSIVAKIGDSFYTSSGIEPQFDDKPFIRKKKGNPGDKNFRSDSIDANGVHWQHFEIYPQVVKEWMRITGESDYTKSPIHGCCAVDLDWTQRVKLQATAQKHVDHSISSTVNLPSDVTVERVAEIYEAAWKYGCKGITVYRDGCRDGVLKKKEEIKVKDSRGVSEIQKTQAPKRPQSLPCEVHHSTFKYRRYYVVVGLLNGEPYEVFTGINHDNEGEIIIPKTVKDGLIYKKSRGNYYLIHQNQDGQEERYHLTNGHTDDTADAMTRMISCALRHGSDISYVVDQLEKTKGDLVSFTKVLARTLKKYISDGVITGDTCPDCGSKLVRQSGCPTCRNCGYGKCS